MRASPLFLATAVCVAAFPGAPHAVTCPPDAVPAGPVCVDKYEASIWRLPAGSAAIKQKIMDGTVTKAELQAVGAVQHGCFPGQAPYPAKFPASGNWTKKLYAVSLPNVRPSTCVSWFQAEQACAISGKRLLTNQEWQRAAAGTPDPGTDDGSTSCNTSSAGVDATGAREACVSKWGAFDMVGNVWERVADWVDRSSGCADWTTEAGIAGSDVSCFGGPGGAGSPSIPSGLLRGGYWHLGADAGVFAVGGFLLASGAGDDVGFRCGR